MVHASTSIPIVLAFCVHDSKVSQIVKVCLGPRLKRETHCNGFLGNILYGWDFKGQSKIRADYYKEKKRKEQIEKTKAKKTKVNKIKPIKPIVPTIDTSYLNVDICEKDKVTINFEFK